MNIFNLLAPIYDYMHWGARKSFRNVEQFGDFKSTDRVLDIGGGTGRTAQFLVGKVEEIVVLDNLPAMIAQCQQKANLKCVIGNAEHLSFSDSSFDKIIMIDAFHHFSNQEQVIREVNRVLGPQGRVVIEEFNPNTKYGKFIVGMERVLRIQSKFYNPLDLKRLWLSHGFEGELKQPESAVYYLVLTKR